MNSIDELPRKEKLEKLCRLTCNGRIDAAIKLAEVLEEIFVQLEQPAFVPVIEKPKKEKVPK